MANHKSLLFCFISYVLVLGFALRCRATDEQKEVYIVYMGSLPEGGEHSVSSQHLNIIQQATGTTSAQNLLVRSYKRSFNGFAAKLTNDEKQKLAKMKEVVSVFPDRLLKLHTTRSWDFIGLNDNVTRNVGVENGITIGVIDTGIWPESDSFMDDGFGPPPKKWKGACQGGSNFTCNNKLIGARFYAPSKSARDRDGHGSHVASIAAGNHVDNVSFYGFGRGTARGGVPSSRIAAYKVCAEAGCSSSSVLAAFDDAIADGVDIITISMGPSHPSVLDTDPIAVGSFHAMEKGVLTVNSAGNTGGFSTVASVAPWLFSVAASTTDREFVDELVLGNGTTIVGRSLNAFESNGTKIPMIHGGAAPSSRCPEDFAYILASACYPGCLDEKLVKGKIVVCDKLDGGDLFDTRTGFEAFGGSLMAGANGAVLRVKNTLLDMSFATPLPGIVLSSDQYKSLLSYAKSSQNPQLQILKTQEIKDSFAPILASFSSRGPNVIVHDVMKPDISAPGVNILAAYSPVGSPSGEPLDTRRVKYDILSGTSAACPHVAAVTAYVKSFHPDWSPAAIKSAIMTTAWPMDRNAKKYDAFGYGSGHVNPVGALNPGLIYETNKEDYLQILCNSNYTMTRDQNPNCRPFSKEPYARDLNYPALTAMVPPRGPVNLTFNRVVTNVGFANSTYKVVVLSDAGLSVKVEPDVITFKGLHEKKGYVVSVSAPELPKSPITHGSLTWSDGTHHVTSPLLVCTRYFSIDG